MSSCPSTSGLHCTRHTAFQALEAVASPLIWPRPVTMRFHVFDPIKKALELQIWAGWRHQGHSGVVPWGFFAEMHWLVCQRDAYLNAHDGCFNSLLSFARNNLWTGFQLNKPHITLNNTIELISSLIFCLSFLYSRVLHHESCMSLTQVTFSPKQWLPPFWSILASFSSLVKYLYQASWCYKLV